MDVLPPMKIFGFEAAATNTLTSVPRDVQSFRKLSISILNGVLTINDMDMDLPANATRRELADFVFSCIEDRGFHHIDNPVARRLMPLCSACNVVEASLLYLNCGHYGSCFDCLEAGLNRQNPPVPQEGRLQGFAPCPRCHVLHEVSVVLDVDL